MATDFASQFNIAGTPTYIGPTGPQGATGIAGTPGNTVRSAPTNPVDTTGTDGDYWINTVTDFIWGPRIGGTYGTSGISLIGPVPWILPPVNWSSGVTYTATAPASLVINAGTIYVCTTTHLSSGSFDPSKFAQVSPASNTASPAFTGVPTAPTATAGNNSTQLATTAYADNSVASRALRYDAAQSLTGPQSLQARQNALAAASGANADITALSGLTTPLSIAQGGTAASTALAAIIALGLVPMVSDGGCYLQYTSSTVVTLIPVNGGTVVVNGSPVQLPSAGVTLSNTGLTAGTLYYVYLTPTLTLEASTTGVTKDAYGRYNKTGDVTRRWVGFVYPNTGTPGVFLDSSAYNGVASYFNRRSKINSITGSPASASTSPSALLTLGVTLGFGDDIYLGVIKGYCSNASGAGVSNWTWFYISGTQVGGSVIFTSTAANYQQNISLVAPFSPVLGAFTGQVYGQVSSGTSTWAMDAYIVARN